MGIFLFAPAGTAERIGVEVGVVASRSEEPAQDEEAGRVAARRPVPVCDRNLRRLTAFFFERASIQCTPRPLALTFTIRWNYTLLRPRSKPRIRSRKSFY